MKRILCILFAAALAASCYKDVPPSTLVGSWQSVHEDWTLFINGKKTQESYDLKTDPADDFAQMQLYHPSLYILTSTNLKTSEKTMTMIYSDRFSPLESGTAKHAKSTLSVKMKNGRLKSGKTYWGVVSLQNSQLVMDYDSGELEVDDVKIQRKCRFVFEKTWDKVIRQ